MTFMYDYDSDSISDECISEYSIPDTIPFDDNISEILTEPYYDNDVIIIEDIFYNI